MNGTKKAIPKPLPELAIRIEGFDDRSRGGLPRNRTSLISPERPSIVPGNQFVRDDAPTPKSGSLGNAIRVRAAGHKTPQDIAAYRETTATWSLDLRLCVVCVVAYIAIKTPPQRGFCKFSGSIKQQRYPVPCGGARQSPSNQDRPASSHRSRVPESASVPTPSERRCHRQ